MNKKFFLALFAVIGLLFATSCSHEEMDAVQDSEMAQVTFSLGVENAVGTKAISDGTQADYLVYAVYKLNEKGIAELQNVVGSTNGQFVKENFKSGDNVSITLAKGQTYKVAFWAQDADCRAYNTTDLTNVTVDYTGVNNDELRDAFFKTVEFEVAGNKTLDVVMERPFAQINVGVTAEDWDAAVASGIIVDKSSVVINKAANEINLLTGEVDGNVEVEYELNAIPDETLYVETDAQNDGKEAYHWLSMSYILVNDAETVDNDKDGTFGDSRTTLESLEFTFGSNGNPITFADGLNNVPVQRNWRTNILGKILTGDIQFNITIDPVYDGDIDIIYPGYTVASTTEEVKDVFAKGGNVILANDIKFDKITSIQPGAEVYLNLNGKTITVDENTTSNTLMYVKEGAKLTIDGNGTIDLGEVSTMAIFAPYGELVIENGTFIRDKVTTVTDKTTGLFMGCKVTSSKVTINGGYFDPGYYDTNAADIEEIIAGTKEFVETADDVAKRGNSKDANLVRVALKDNISAVLNHSGYGSFKIYGGTFVGANPAWGDEGCMLPTTPDYLRPWSYYQGALLDGQTFNENGIVLPAGYNIVKGATVGGIPTYTVSYNK